MRNVTPPGLRDAVASSNITGALHLEKAVCTLLSIDETPLITGCTLEKVPLEQKMLLERDCQRDKAASCFYDAKLCNIVGTGEAVAAGLLAIGAGPLCIVAAVPAAIMFYQAGQSRDQAQQPLALAGLPDSALKDIIEQWEAQPSTTVRDAEPYGILEANHGYSAFR